jgi:hypothetical protein
MGTTLGWVEGRAPRPIQTTLMVQSLVRLSISTLRTTAARTAVSHLSDERLGSRQNDGSPARALYPSRVVRTSAWQHTICPERKAKVGSLCTAQHDKSPIEEGLLEQNFTVKDHNATDLTKSRPEDATRQRRSRVSQLADGSSALVNEVARSLVTGQTSSCVHSRSFPQCKVVYQGQGQRRCIAAF